MQYENYDPSFPDQPVVDQYLPVWANLPAFQSKPAFIWSEAQSSSSSSTLTLTYAQLNASVHLISSKLLNIPLQRRDTVVILCPPGLLLVKLIFACQRAGLLSVPITPPHPSFSHQNYHHLLRALSQTNPTAALAHRHYISTVQRYVSSSSSPPPPPHYNQKLARLLQTLRWISIDDDDAFNDGNLVNLDMSSYSYKYNGCRAEDVYLVQYTSGATGIPKPVLVTAGSAAHNVRTARTAYDLHPNTVIVSWLPQYHDCGLMFLLLTIVSGATCVLTSPTAFINRPRLWLELMTEFKATCTPVPSFTLPLVVKRGGIAEKGTIPINLSCLNNLIIINEPIYRASVDEFVRVLTPFGLNPSSISPSYGLAENGTFVSTAWRSRNDHSFPTHRKLLPVARLCYNQEDMDIVVVNEETCEAVEDGVEGEIWVSSPSNASGYLGHPSLTREVFHGRLRNTLGRCFVRTGDTGVVKGEQRFLFVTGRCQDVIQLQGGRKIIHPHYIESTAYHTCPKLLRGGCIAAFKISTTITTAIVAEMQRVEKQEKVLRRICEEIREGVAEEEGVEVGLVALVKSGCVPKTTSGKLQRWLAKQKFIAGEMTVLMKMQFGNEVDNLAQFGSTDENVLVRGNKAGTRCTE
ncbi:Long-chain-fatty-acid--AMP ligase FadD26 [Senna tora]|uniref:Long-chain-fatty-acid--AMP ligase FadD26 n=1 Tax=Senna tora TaxID=362788 RepID=A0A834TW47_9FABA|nr:Long-chain-fatty-acid--AMP ligase FadD26 [Senna tora]